jgi:hypothetical protein
MSWEEGIPSSRSQCVYWAARRKCLACSEDAHAASLAVTWNGGKIPSHHPPSSTSFIMRNLPKMGQLLSLALLALLCFALAGTSFAEEETPGAKIDQVSRAACLMLFAS